MNPRIMDSKEALREEHRALDLRLRRLERRPYLTTAQQLEATELKKKKLLAKDALAELSRAD